MENQAQCPAGGHVFTPTNEPPEFQQHIYWQAYMDGDWYDDDEGFLYIITAETSDLEHYGPENEIMDEINRLSRQKGMPTEDDCVALGLFRIYEHQKRWTPEDGYYYT